MMKREGRIQPLRKMIFRIMAVSIVLVCILSIIMMAVEYHMLGSMKATIEKSNVFADYYDRLEQLHISLADYVHTNQQEKREECEALQNALGAYSRQMKEEFENPQFLDNYYLTESYLDAVQMVLDTSAALLSEPEMEIYQDCEKVYGYLKDNENNLNSVRSKTISDTYEQQFNTWKKQFFLIVLTMLLVGGYLFLFSNQMIQKILKPLTMLTDQVRQFEKGNRTISLITEGDMEIEETKILTAAFMKMTATIERQFKELKEKMALDKKLHEANLQNTQVKIALAETKVQLIQSMISPHFLFNCLNTLSGMAYFEDAPRTREASIKIAQYLRNSLSLVGKSISVKEELTHTLDYLEIQKLRFQEKLSYTIRCERKCETLRLPAMILQPLVENSISHGLKNSWQGGNIEIFVEKQEGALYLKVCDNGKGIEEKRLEEIKAGLKEPFEPGKHTIGLYGVASRLRNYFQNRVSIEVESVLGEGTSILITIKEN